MALEFSYPLEEQTPDPGPVPTPRPASPPLQPQSTPSLKRFLGIGLAAPALRTGGGSYETVAEEQLVAQSIRQILGTISRPNGDGEIPWRTDVGSMLPLLRHRKNDYVLEEMAQAYVVDAIAKHEPRAKVTQVEIYRGSSTGDPLTIDTISVRVNYRIVGMDGMLKSGERSVVVSL